MTIFPRPPPAFVSVTNDWGRSKVLPDVFPAVLVVLLSAVFHATLRAMFRAVFPLVLLAVFSLVLPAGLPALCISGSFPCAPWCSSLCCRCVSHFALAGVPNCCIPRGVPCVCLYLLLSAPSRVRWSLLAACPPSFWPLIISSENRLSARSLLSGKIRWR